MGAAKTQLGNFNTATKLYRLDHHGRCPTTRQDLQALIDEPAPPPPGPWQGPYLSDVSQIPLDPCGSPYRYESPGPDGEL